MYHGQPVIALMLGFCILRPWPKGVSARAFTRLSCCKYFSSGAVQVSSRFTFPDAEDVPTSLSERLICRMVAGLISLKLGSPLLGVGSAKLFRPVLGAVVPIAPINEYSEPITRKYQVRRELSNPLIQSEPESQRMYGSAKP